MPRVPFIGRLFLREYIALLGSFVLIGLEIFVRVVTLALPGPIIRFFYKSSRRLFNYLSSPQGRKSRNKKRVVVNSIAQASDFVELCELYGYSAEEHIVQTQDGYLLGLHRLAWKKGEEDKRVNGGQGSVQKKVVYLHHGLMMNSEVWVCLTERERCLPFMLVDRGYDVWLGNNRGNKYSKKSVNHSPTEIPFWNFSMDQFAFHDIPDSIDYVLSTTQQPSLSYIGFSQGTAQAFATLSIHPTLNDKVDVFIALAPAMSPPGLNRGIVDSFVKASPEVLFLAFGRRAILGSATMWEALLYPPIFVRLIDYSLSFLFGWHSRNMTPHQKLAAYPHLYSFTSTKSVVHWFQIIRNGNFQMYDDEVQAPLSIINGGKYYKVAKFPTRNIKTPIVLVYGGSDSLVDITIMLKELPKHTVAKEIPHYEHLDFLWASDVDTQVFPHVFDALDSYASPDNRKDQPALYRTSRPNNPALVQPPSYSEDERGPRGPRRAASYNISDFGIDGGSPDTQQANGSADAAGPGPEAAAAALRALRNGGASSSLFPVRESPDGGAGHSPSPTPSPSPSASRGSKRHSRIASASSSTHPTSPPSSKQPTTPPRHQASRLPQSSASKSKSPRPRLASPNLTASPPPLPNSPSASHFSQRSTASRPEGWWSSDEESSGSGSGAGGAAEAGEAGRTGEERAGGTYDEGVA
ncbi:cholesterol esterase [Cryomyces antarcticus]|nr:cholesterol esterase [Cryomyces antarcticus]